MNFDDQPVGQRNELLISEQPSEEDPTLSPKENLPLGDRLRSKNPKTRLCAMSELLNLFTSQSDSSTFMEYYSGFPKYLADTHPGTQEKAIEAFTLLITRSSPQVDKTLNSSINMLIEKGLNSTKGQIKPKAVECILKLAESVSMHETIKEQLKGKLKVKTNAKISTGAIQLIIQLLVNYGNKYFPVKDFVDLVAALAESKDDQVRVECLTYLKEAYKWEKSVVEEVVKKLRQAQRDELNKQFAEIVGAPKALKVVQGGEEESVENKEKKVVMDSYALASEVSVLKKFGDHWCSQIMEAKKWSEKRDKLEDLLKAVSVEKIKNENFSELGKVLKLLLQDPNIVVSNLALKVIGQLAKGLRNNLSTYSKHTFETIVQKLKDKKSVTEAQKCLDNLVFSLKLEDMIEQIKDTLTDKSPLIKARICLWIEQSILPRASPSLLKVFGTELGPTLIKLTDDAASDVRESALNCLRRMKFLLEDNPNFAKLLTELNSQKQDKVSAKPQEVVKMKGKEENKHNESSESNTKLQEFGKDSLKKDTLKRSATAPKHMNKVTEKLKKEIGEPSLDEAIGEAMSLEDATKAVEKVVPSEITGLFDIKDWKEKQKGVKEFKVWIESSNEEAQKILEPIAVWLKGKLKDFKESNQGIMKECYNVLQTIADTCIVGKSFASTVIPPLIDRMSDAKTLEACISIILSISDSANPWFVSILVIKCGQNTKNLNATKGIITLLSKMLEGYGANLIPVKASVDFVKLYLAHSNAQLRTSATNYIVSVYELVGEIINGWLGTELKESTYKTLEAQFSKTKVNQITEVKRNLRGESAEYAAKNKKKNVVDSLAPKINISTQITTKIISGLSDSSMKLRQEAKDAIEKILFAANNRILPAGLNSLMVALKGRMSEPCKNLAKGFITLLGNIASAMGSGFKQYHKLVVQPLLCNVSDKQSAIRSETLIAMDKIAEIGPDLILNNLAPLLEKENQDVRTTLLSWVIRYKDHLNKCDCQSFVVPLVAVMQDKSKEIRAMAEQVVGVIIENIGYGVFANAIQDLKPAVKLSLESVLEKYKPSVRSREESKEYIEEPNKEIGEVEMPEQVIIELNTNIQEGVEETVEASNEVQQENNIPKENEELNLINYTPKEEEGESKKEIEDKVIESKENNKCTPAKEIEDHEPLMSFNSLINNADRTPCDSQANTSIKLSLQKSNTLAESEFEVVASPVKQIMRSEMSTCRSTNDLQKKFESKRMVKEVKKVSKKVNRTRINRVSQSPNCSQMNKTRYKVEGIIIGMIGNKENRAEIDKALKWPINEVREDYMEKLKKSLKNIIRQDLFDSMFSPLFKKNIFALNLLIEGLSTEMDGLLDLTDILFKWLVSKLIDQSNSAIIKTIFEFLAKFFKAMQDKGYCMLDFEAAAIFPTLSERLGTTNIIFKQQLKDLLKQAAVIYNPTKLAGHILNAIEVTKNQKTKIECIEILRELAGKYGAIRVYPVKYIKNFVKLLASSDNILKAESMEVLVEIYKSRGESIWTLMGEVPEKSKEMLKNKFAMCLNKEKRAESPEFGINNIEEKVIHRMKEQDKSANKENSKTEESLFIDDSKTKTPISRRTSNNVMSLMNEQCDGLLEANIQFNTTSAITLKNRDEEASEKKTDQILKINTIEQALQTLKGKDISTQVDALMYINERTISTEDKETLRANNNAMLQVFAEVLNDTFDKAVTEIPIRFAKYFMTVVNKICSSKTIINGITEDTYYTFAEQLLSKLLYNGLGSIGNNNEGDFLVKSFNSTMLRLLENCSPTKSFIVLIRLFVMYKNVPAAIGNIKSGKLPSLIVKCILKLTKVMNVIVHSLDVAELLVCLHEKLTTALNTRTINDDTGIRLAKTITNELVKVRGNTIWEDYKKIEEHNKPDIHIKRWISFALKTTTLSSSVTKTHEIKALHSDESLAELKEIFKQLNSKGGFQDGIASLSQYMARHPEIDLSPYFVSCSKNFKDYVMDALKRSNTKGGETTRIVKNDRKATESTLLEWKSKLAVLKKKLDTGKSDNTSMLYKTTGN